MSISMSETPLSPQQTREAAGLQLRNPEHNQFDSLRETLQSDNDRHRSKDRHGRPMRRRDQWLPRSGIAKIIYAAIIFLLILVAVITPVTFAKQLSQARADASKPLHTQPFEKLPMPTNTSRIFRDAYNTSTIYRVFPGEDRSGNDLFATLAYTVEACLLACNKYNEFVAAGRQPCLAGTMNYNQYESAFGQRGANCFLKTKAGSEIDTTNPLALGFRLCPSNRCVFNNTALENVSDRVTRF